MAGVQVSSSWVDVGLGSCYCVEDMAVVQHPSVPFPPPLPGWDAPGVLSMLVQSNVPW